MIFTDDDLKRWKEEDSCYSIEGRKALLARLEAAENVIWKWIALDDSIALGSSSDMETHNKIANEAEAAMDIWRRAGGK